jgi:NitT/TauT family transport system substrate-binding protein
MRHRLVAVGAVALSLAVLGACGGDDEDDGGNASSGPAKITLGLNPLADVAPAFLAQSLGYFEEEGLDVEIKTLGGAEEVTPALEGGAIDIGWSNTATIAAAAGKGLDFKILVGGVESTEERDTSGLMVKGDSDIREPKDLEGKTVGISRRADITDVLLQASLEKLGVDRDKVEIVELQSVFSRGPTALEQGRVDAVFLPEPAVTLVEEQQGARKLFQPLSLTIPDAPFNSFYATQEWIDANQEAAEGFVRAIERALKYSENNLDEVRAAVPEFTEIPPEVAKTMTLSVYSDTIDVDALKNFVDLSARFGETEPVDVNDLLSELASTR